MYQFVHVRHRKTVTCSIWSILCACNWHLPLLASGRLWWLLLIRFMAVNTVLQETPSGLFIVFPIWNFNNTNDWRIRPLVCSAQICFQIHIRQFPVPESYKLLVSFCRLSALTAKPLQVSEVLNVRPSLNDISSGQRRDVCAMVEGRPGLSVAFEQIFPWTGARLETLIVCRLLL